MKKKQGMFYLLCCIWSNKLYKYRCIIHNLPKWWRHFLSASKLLSGCDYIFDAISWFQDRVPSPWVELHIAHAHSILLLWLWSNCFKCIDFIWCYFQFKKHKFMLLSCSGILGENTWTINWYTYSFPNNTSS